ncbi:DUF6296 family protein [Streptomyces sp. NRRL B-24484]|uniref:DUF6296 family protein n=1 Tax=Streptomyces sp. NRRL B-24484 TaxID=1463833 RepID=UPI000AF7EE3D
MPTASGTWLLTYPRPEPDGTAGTDVVTVAYQGTEGPDGRPLYRSADGRVSTEIAPGGLVHHLTPATARRSPSPTTTDWCTSPRRTAGRAPAPPPTPSRRRAPPERTCRRSRPPV